MDITVDVIELGNFLDIYECSKNTHDSTNLILSNVWAYRRLLEDTNQEYARGEILSQNSPGRYVIKHCKIVV